MTAANDLIRRQEAIGLVRAKMKHVYTAARKLGYKESIEVLTTVPSAGESEVSVAEHVSLSPAPLHSFWFYNAGWFFCDNCGGKSDSAGYTPYCAHCGARMDQMTEIE